MADKTGTAPYIPEPRSSRMEVAGDEYLVLSVRSAAAPWDCLSVAELEVCMAACYGMSNAEIAGLRGCKERTVANQFAAACRKLGVSCRAELTSILGVAAP